MSLSRKAKAAIAKYGEAACIKAHSLNHHDGEGASNIAFGGFCSLIKTTRQADAAIDAGREIFKQNKLAIANNKIAE